MAEDFYAALMMRKALPESVDITTITAPGIYPVDVGNASAPSSHGGVLVVLPPQINPSLTFVDANDHAPWSFVDGEWSSAVRTVNSKRPVNGSVSLDSGDILSQYSQMNSTGGYDLNHVTSAGIQSVISDEVAASELNTGFPVPLAGLLVVLEGVAGVTQFYYVRQSSAIYTRSGKPDAFSADDWTPWAIHYTSENKPTASDTGAIPKDPIGVIKDGDAMASASAPGWWLVSVENPDTVADFPVYPGGSKMYGYGFLFVGHSGNTWLQQYFAHQGQSASRQTWNGDFSAAPWVVGYNTINPPPATDLSGYETIADANARFVTATRFGANMSTAWGSGGGTAPAGCALTGGDFNSDSEYPIYAYLQYCVNGVWINATGGVGSPSHVLAGHYQPVPEAGVTQLLNLRPYQRNNPELPGVQHYIDENGLDWFEAAPALRGTVFIAYSPDDGVIIQIADSSLPDTDAYSLHPDSVNIAGLDSLPDGCSIDGSWFFDGETIYRDITVILPRIYQRNRQRRDNLLAKCISYATAIQFSAARNTARTGDDAAIQALHRVADELRDVDLSAENPAWPEIPDFLNPEKAQ